ncbi:MAG: hypothetical protein IPG18_04705 [Saprospiraceae bacterium]|nr:hypothetical protein [Saprospiraceae bacterium]
MSLAKRGAKAVYHFITLGSQEKEQNTSILFPWSDIQRQGSYPNVYSNIINNGIIPIMNQDFEMAFDDLHGL